MKTVPRRLIGVFVALVMLLAHIPSQTPLNALNTTNSRDLIAPTVPSTAIARVSISSAGAQGNAGSGAPSVSSDGRYAAFYSYASNLVSGDTNGYPDVFVHDRQTGQTTRVSLSSSGAQANDYSFLPSISGDGRYVAFDSYATNLASPCTNGHDQIFVRDWQSGTTACVSLSSTGQQGNGESSPAIISADGRYVAFASASTNLVSGDTNNAYDIFVRDRQNNTTERVSVSSSEAEGNSGAEQFGFSISADGRYVAFASNSTDLVSGDTNGVVDIFVRDRQAGTTSRVSVSSGGVQGNGAASYAAISSDGRYVAFNSCADNLVSGDTNNECDVFVRDRQSGTTQRIMMGYDGTEANGSASDLLSISADGRFVTFVSSATNLVPGDNNAADDVFVHDRQSGETWRLSVDSNGQEATGSNFPVSLSNKPAISGDGSVIAFESGAANLVSGDTNDARDIFARARGAAPTYPYLTAAPTSLPADGTTTTSITLLRATPGHTVRLLSNRGGLDTFANPIGVVNSSGQYATTLRSSAAGNAVVTVLDLSSGATLPASVQVTFTPTGGGGTLPPQTGPLAITAVRPTYPLDGRYLQGLSAPNQIAVTVDWRGSTPGRVDFVLNGAVFSEPASSSGASHTFNMGSVLRSGQNSLRLIAYNAEGQASQPVDYAPFSVAAPLWMSGLQAVGSIASLTLGGSWSAGHEYSAGLVIPSDGIDLGAPGFGPSGSSTKLSFGIGGGFYLPMTCSKPVKLRVEAGADVDIDLVGVGLGGSLVGSGSLEGHSVQCEIPTASGTIRVDATVYGRRSWPVLTFVVDFIAPGAGTSLQQTLPREVLTVLGQIYLQGNLNAYLSADVETISASPYLEWTGLAVGGGPRLAVGYHYEVRWLNSELNVELAAAGSLEFYNSNPLTDLSDLEFDHITISGEAGYKARVFGLWYQKSFVIEWEYPEGLHRVVSEGLRDAAGWSPIGHNDSPDYAVFVGGRQAARAFALRQAAAAGTVTSTLVSNVFTYTQPVLAVNPANDHALLLWVHDVVTKPIGQSHEIAFSRWDGSTWSAPVLATDDSYLDSAPQVAWASGMISDALAIWERLPAPLPVTATWDVTTAQQIEIAWATYDESTGLWSAPALLTNNNALDMRPQLARNSNGQLLAVWRQNDGGALYGDPSNPDRIMAAFFNGGWTSAPAAAVDNLPGLVELSAGYGSGAATIAYTRYLTPTGSSTPTLQLFTSQWNGSSWGTPVQRTDDDRGHRAPQVIYNGTNQPLLVWLARDDLRLWNLTTGATATLTLPEAIGSIDQFRVVRDGANNVAVVLTAQAAQRDMYLSFYDATYGLWGLPRLLTSDAASERYPAPALDSGGDLLMGYVRTALEPVTRTAVISGTGETVTYTLPTEGQSDLMTMRHEFERNLAATGLVVSDDHPVVGATLAVSATVQNRGDRALDAVAVAFYDGDPGFGGTLIGKANSSAPLAAGMTATVSVPYTVPTVGGAHVLYAVADPDHLVTESDEADNTATLAAFGPDLEVVSAGVDYWGGNDVGLVTLVRNVGTSDAPTTTLAFYRDALTGTLAVTDTVPMLAAGQTVTRTTPWNSGPLSAGDYPLVAVVNQGQFSETWTANNVFTFTLDVRPDLMVSPYYLWTSSPTGTTVLVTATVYNLGVITATDAVVGFYGDDRLDGGTALFTRTIPVLGPAGSTTLSGQVSGPLACTLYAYVDPGRTVTETTRTNNLAGISYRGLCQRVYLPLVLR